VFAVVGNVGTPTAEKALPYALEKKLLYFGAYTGGLLRKGPPDRYAFNYRASLEEETAAAVRYLVEVRRVRPEQIAVFDQRDSYGDSGFRGVVKWVRRHGRDPDQVVRVRYPRNTLQCASRRVHLRPAPGPGPGPGRGAGPPGAGRAPRRRSGNTS
jgi:hypothetical protein